MAYYTPKDIVATIIHLSDYACTPVTAVIVYNVSELMERQKINKKLKVLVKCCSFTFQFMIINN